MAHARVLLASDMARVATWPAPAACLPAAAVPQWQPVPAVAEVVRELLEKMAEEEVRGTEVTESFTTGSIAAGRNQKEHRARLRATLWSVWGWLPTLSKQSNSLGCTSRARWPIWYAQTNSPLVSCVGRDRSRGNGWQMARKKSKPHTGIGGARWMASSPAHLL